MIILKLIERIKNNKAIKKTLLIILLFIALYILYIIVNVEWFRFKGKALEFIRNAFYYTIQYCGIGLASALTAIPIISIISNVKAKKSKWITVSSACIFVVGLVEYCVFMFVLHKSDFLSKPFAYFAELFYFFPLLSNLVTFAAALLATICLFSKGRKINYVLLFISPVVLLLMYFACLSCMLASLG